MYLLLILFIPLRLPYNCLLLAEEKGSLIINLVFQKPETSERQHLFEGNSQGDFYGNDVPGEFRDEFRFSEENIGEFYLKLRI